MSNMENFQKEVEERIAKVSPDQELSRLAAAFMAASTLPKYSYNFFWQGRPIIQYPQDIVAIQELIWTVKPDLIIETGVAHGGSILLSAAMLAQLDYCEAVEKGLMLDPRKTDRKVIGIDIDIRSHNRIAIEEHPMAHFIHLIEGSSVAPEIITQVQGIAKKHKRIMVCLDSNHTHDHVLQELEAYAPLTSAGSYCCVFDTIVEDLPANQFPNRPWSRGNNPKTAVWEYLRVLQKDKVIGLDGQRLAFEIDKSVEKRLLITVAPDGYLKRV